MNLSSVLDTNGFSDREAVAAVMQGDIKAVEYLFAYLSQVVFSPIVQRYGVSFGMTPEALCAEVYLHLAEHDWARLRSFEFRSSLRTWIWAVSLNIMFQRNTESVKALMKRKNAKYLTFIEALNHEEFLFKSPEKPESALLLGRAVRMLDNPYYRTLIQLRAFEGYSAKETAQLLKRSPGAVDQGYMRAKRELKVLLCSIKRGGKEDAK